MAPLRTLFGADAGIVRDADFQLLLFANVVAPLGGAIVSPILDSLTGPFGISPARAGLLMSVLAAPGIVMIPLAGMLADRYGRKALLTGGLVLFGGAGAAIALTTDFRVALALRLLQGFGFAGISPIIITSIGDLYEGAEEATAQGLRFATSGLSLVVFPLLAGSLVVLAWQYPFLLYAIALPLAALVYLRFEEPTDRPGSASDGGTPRRPAERASHLRELFRLAARPHVLAVLIARGLPNVVWIGLLTYNSVIVVRLLDGTPREAGLLVAVGSLAFAGSASQAGRVTARVEGRRGPLLVANGCLAVGFALVAFASSVPVAVAGAVVAGLGFGITLSLYRSIVTGLAPAALRGGLVSLGESFGRVTATLTPVVMGAAIAVLEPAVGFAGAVRWTSVAAGGLAGVAGIGCLLVAGRSPSGLDPDAA